MTTTRPFSLAALALLSAAAVLAFASTANAAPCTSSTPTGSIFYDNGADSEAALAPELTALRVSLDSSCNVKFAYDVSGQSSLLSGEFYSWFIDSDNNAATGASGAYVGADYAVGMLDTGFAAVSVWNGSTWSNSVTIVRSETFGASAKISQIGGVSGVPIKTAGGASWTSSVSGNSYYDWVPDGINQWLTITPTFSAQAGGGNGGGGGSGPCVVPSVRGLTLESAKRKIRNARCSVGKIRKRKNNRYVGRVISTSPSKGAVRPAGTKVSIYVGKRAKRSRSTAVGSADLLVARLREVSAVR